MSTVCVGAYQRLHAKSSCKLRVLQLVVSNRKHRGMSKQANISVCCVHSVSNRIHRAMSKQAKISVRCVHSVESSGYTCDM